MYKSISSSERRLFKVAKMIVMRLNESIARGEIDPGDRVPNASELAKILNVSHQDLRTGRRLLIASGIFRSTPGVGTFISRPSSAISIDPAPFRLLAIYHEITMDEISEAGISLEISAASLAADRASSDQLITMAEEIGGMFASLDDPDRFLDHDLRFHQTVAYASHNRLLMMLKGIVSQIQVPASCGLFHTASDLKGRAETHRNIYQAIRSRDSEATRNITRRELTESRKEPREFPGMETIEIVKNNRNGVLTIS